MQVAPLISQWLYMDVPGCTLRYLFLPVCRFLTQKPISGLGQMLGPLNAGVLRALRYAVLINHLRCSTVPQSVVLFISGLDGMGSVSLDAQVIN